MASAVLSDGRRGKNTRHVLSGLLRQSVFGRLAACAGLQSRQLHADAGSAGGGQAVVADEPAGKTREDRRQGRVPWPLRHLPDGRARGAEGIVPGNLTADRRTATKTVPSVANRRGGSLITTKGVRLDSRKNGQIAGPDVVRYRWNAESTAQRTHGFPGTPPSAIVHAVPGHLGRFRRVTMQNELKNEDAPLIT